jgi:hypothetical protein
MVKEPSHVKYLSPNHECEIELKEKQHSILYLQIFGWIRLYTQCIKKWKALGFIYTHFLFEYFLFCVCI